MIESKSLCNKINSNTGITLVALVITIIVLMILAAVAMSLITEDGNLFEKAKLASESYTNASKKEEMIIEELTNEINGIRNINEEEIRRIVQEELQKQPIVKFIDFSNKITTISGASASWTATQDCGIVASIKAPTTSYNPQVYIDGLNVFDNSFSNTNFNTAITFYVKKGSVVTTRNVGTYTLNVYALLN